jgi:hypothetical protein
VSEQAGASGGPGLSARLRDPDPQGRAVAIREVRYRHLKDPQVLARMLELCRDPAVVPGAQASVDPFAAFFGGAPPGGARVADVAAERLLATGLPKDNASVDLVAQALREDSPVERLAEVVTRSLGETQWDDVQHAVRTLVPALELHDVPLFHAITLLPQAAVDVMIERAVQPANARLLQELMNHEPSRPRVVAAIERVAGTAGADEVSLFAAILASWGEPRLSALCAGWTGRFPWVVAWAAIDDPDAGPPLAAWLAQGSPGAPADLFDRVSEVLRRRGCRDSFPLAAWMAAAGQAHGLVEGRTSEAQDEDVATLLMSWVRELAAGRGPVERGWHAAQYLVSHSRHAPVLAELTSALQRQPPDERALPWEPALLQALAGAQPPVPGLGAHLAQRIRTEPLRATDAIGAISALGDPSLSREVAESVLSAAERAELEEVKVGKGVVRIGRRGVDPDSIGPLVLALGDPELRVRLDAVTSVVRAG